MKYIIAINRRRLFLSTVATMKKESLTTPPNDRGKRVGEGEARNYQGAISGSTSVCMKSARVIEDESLIYSVDRGLIIMKGSALDDDTRALTPMRREGDRRERVRCGSWNIQSVFVLEMRKFDMVYMVGEVRFRFRLF